MTRWGFILLTFAINLDAALVSARCLKERCSENDVVTELEQPYFEKCHFLLKGMFSHPSLTTLNSVL